MRKNRGEGEVEYIYIEIDTKRKNAESLNYLSCESVRFETRMQFNARLRL